MAEMFLVRVTKDNVDRTWIQTFVCMDEVTSETQCVTFVHKRRVAGGYLHGANPEGKTRGMMSINLSDISHISVRQLTVSEVETWEKS